MELKHTKHAVGQSAYHLVWRPKYNVAVFRHAWVREVIEQALREAAKRHDIAIYELKVLEDHVHVFAEIPSTIDVSKALQLLKGASARAFFKKCIIWHRFFSRDYTKKAHLWSPGKFFRSVGCVTSEVVERYIKFSNTWDFKYLEEGQTTLTSH
mgnify:CR=1 FL=1